MSSGVHQIVAIFFKKNILAVMNNLLQLREEKKISQEDIAKILGVTRQAYSRYERGERELNYTSLKKLSKFFDVSIDYLLGNSIYFYPDKINKTPLNDELSSEERRLLNQYRSLPDKIKKTIREQIEVYSEPNELLSKSDKKV